MFGDSGVRAQKIVEVELKEEQEPLKLKLLMGAVVVLAVRVHRRAATLMHVQVIYPVPLHANITNLLSIIHHITYHYNVSSDIYNLSESFFCTNPVNCQWNGWGGWGACSKNCGTGTKTRSRTVKVNAAHGGNSCTGSYGDSTSCITKPCPGNVSCSTSCKHNKIIIYHSSYHLSL